MNYKEEIEKLLNLLKTNGVDRAMIEKDFEYAENYIDQALSRGGNKKILAALKIYCKAVLQNTTAPTKAKAANSRGVEGKGENASLVDVMSNLGSIKKDLKKVLSHQVYARAEIRGYGEYQVMKDSQGSDKRRIAIMAQISKLIDANLEDGELADSPNEVDI